MLARRGWGLTSVFKRWSRGWLCAAALLASCGAVFFLRGNVVLNGAFGRGGPGGWRKGGGKTGFGEKIGDRNGELADGFCNIGGWFGEMWVGKSWGNWAEN